MDLDWLDLEWRVLTSTDASAAAALIAAVEAVDDLGESFAPEDFAELLAGSAIDARLGSLGAFAAGGRLAAFGLVYARTAADPVHQMHYWGMVHPDFRRRGIGTEMTRRLLAAAREISQARFPGAPLAMTAAAPDRSPGQNALFESAGFKPHHYDFGMLRPLTAADRAAGTIPEGYALVPFGPEVSEEIRVTHNEAFVPDHPGSTVVPPEVWPERVAVSSFRTDLSFGLRHEASGRMAGYVLVHHFEADTATTGRRDAYVNYLGTRREHRRRGVGAALLSAALHAAAEAGMQTASLDVLAENPTGALGVYKRAGFEVRRMFVVYRREVTGI